MNSTNLFLTLEDIIKSLHTQRLADVFRIISFDPYEKYREHEHTRIEINYVKKGSCILNLQDRSYTFSENEMMIINSNALHSFEAGQAGTVIMQLEFLPEVFPHFNSLLPNASESLNPAVVFEESNRLIKIVNNVRIMRAVQRIINELTTKHKYFDYLVIMYYAELLILIFRYLSETYTPTGTNERLKVAIEYMRVNYHLDISINLVAEKAGVSERYLRKLFMKELGIPPLEYLNRTRIDNACVLLRNTELSVKEVCFMCGFKSPQYFSKVFKAHIGTSPRKNQ